MAYERDMKVMNAATFTVEREDHTVGNVIRMYDQLRCIDSTVYGILRF